MRLGEERELISPGHTLSLIKFGDQIYGYLGYVLFKGVNILSGPSPYQLKHVKNGFLKGIRWGSAIADSKKVYLFFTERRLIGRVPFISPYKYQNVYVLESTDGINFAKKRFILNGSAPFIWKKEGEFYLFYHRRQGDRHIILCRIGHSIEDLFSKNTCREDVLLISHIGETLSAPSVCEINGKIWMTLERREGDQPWQTVLYVGGCVTDLRRHSVLIEEGACAFQHLLGDQFILTYSVKEGKFWKIMCKEGRM